MVSALNLDKLLEGDSTFRTEEEKVMESTRRFVALFARKKGWFIFKKLEYPLFKREQIREILVRNNFVKEGVDIEIAIKEALKKEYIVRTGVDLGLDIEYYQFVEATDQNGCKAYRLQFGERHY